MRRLVPAMIALILLAGCGQSPADNRPTRTTTGEIVAVTRRPTATPTHTPSPSLTPTPTVTATPTSTSTPSPTPTPTALPLAISGDPREAALNKQVSQAGAPCGRVDVLDFPMDPPDGDAVAFGGQDFGVFRRRYDKYHAGEDWWLARGRSNFGLPVHSIGHGTVTYAEPEGWGRDQGVIIVRHIFADGSTVLSFYGHLDPPSVSLAPGDCVTRGEHIANIGRPRTPPHLHFEIRSHMPAQPGTGYWHEDPRLAGWLPPSEFIWNQRMASSPGVLWSRPDSAETRGIDMQGDRTFVLVEEQGLIAIDPADGSERWRLASPDGVHSALFDPSRPLLYLASRTGQITAHRLSELGDGADPSLLAPLAEPAWTFDLERFWAPDLAPLPGGGLVVLVRQHAIALSAEGELLWESEALSRPLDWTLGDGSLVLTTSGRDGSLWSLDREGAVPWEVELTGRPVQVGDEFWLYSAEGIYRLDTTSRSTELLLELPRSVYGLGAALALPGGGLLLAHSDRFDQRLIHLDAAGSVRWQRSYAALGRGEQRLVQIGNQPYLLAPESGSASNELSLFLVDMERDELVRLLTGGSRTLPPGQEWMAAVGDDLLLLRLGPTLAALDVRQAGEAIGDTAGSR